MSDGRLDEEWVDQAFYGSTPGYGVGLLSTSSRERIARWDSALKQRVWVAPGQQRGFVHLRIDTFAGAESVIVRKVATPDAYQRASTSARVLIGSGLTPRIAVGLMRWPGWDRSERLPGSAEAPGPLRLGDLKAAAQKGLAQLRTELFADPRTVELFVHLVAGVIALPDAEFTVFRGEGAMPVEPLLGGLLQLLEWPGRRPWTFATCETDATGTDQPRIVFTTTANNPPTRTKLVLDPLLRAEHGGVYSPAERELRLAKYLVDSYRDDPDVGKTAPPLGTSEDFDSWIASLRDKRPSTLVRKGRRHLTDAEARELDADPAVDGWLANVPDSDLAVLLPEWSDGEGHGRAPKTAWRIRADAVDRVVHKAAQDDTLLRAVLNCVPAAEIELQAYQALAALERSMAAAQHPHHGTPRLADLLQALAGLGVPLKPDGQAGNALRGLTEPLRATPSELVKAADKAASVGYVDVAGYILGCASGQRVDPSEQEELTEVLLEQNLALPLTEHLRWKRSDRVQVVGRLMRSALGPVPSLAEVNRLLEKAPEGSDRQLAALALATTAKGLEPPYQALVLGVSMHEEFRRHGLAELLDPRWFAGADLGGHAEPASVLAGWPGPNPGSALVAQPQPPPRPPQGDHLPGNPAAHQPLAAPPPPRRRPWPLRRRPDRDDDRYRDGRIVASLAAVLACALLLMIAVLWVGGVFSDSPSSAPVTPTPSATPSAPSAPAPTQGFLPPIPLPKGPKLLGPSSDASTATPPSPSSGSPTSSRLRGSPTASHSSFGPPH